MIFLFFLSFLLPATCPPSASPSGEAGGSRAAQARRAGTKLRNTNPPQYDITYLPQYHLPELQGRRGMPAAEGEERFQRH